MAFKEKLFHMASPVRTNVIVQNSLSQSSQICTPLNPAEKKTQSLMQISQVAFITASFLCSPIASISLSSDDLLVHVGGCFCVCVFAIISQTSF